LYGSWIVLLDWADRPDVGDRNYIQILLGKPLKEQLLGRSRITSQYNKDDSWRKRLWELEMD
jgi:hypothetical protein